MLRGLYTAASGMIAQQRRHDVVTNNIANINTPGFKQGNAINRSFPEMLIARTRGGEDQPLSVPIGGIHTGVMAEENVSLHARGDILETNNPFDFAILSDIEVPGAAFDASGQYVGEDGQRIAQPQAFFTVLNAQGEQRYSLNGKFSVNAQGQMIDSEGNPVLGRDGQPIVLLEPGTDLPIANFRITNTGLFVNADGQPIIGASGEPANLLLTRIENPNQLLREGNGLYRLNDGGEARLVEAEDRVEVRQGFVERSNVDAAQSMVDMMSALRAYEANQKVIQFYDRSMDKAVNEIGRV